MRILLLALCLSACSSANLNISLHHNLILVQSQNGQFSCLANNCCYPYREKVMVCSEANTNDVSMTIKYVPDK